MQMIGDEHAGRHADRARDIGGVGGLGDDHGLLEAEGLAQLLLQVEAFRASLMLRTTVTRPMSSFSAISF
jgi:hypothetical protein